MDKEKIQLYSTKYKHHQKVLGIIVTVIIILFGIGIMVGGSLLAYYNQNGYVLGVAIIMIILGIADIYLAVKFIKFELNKLKYMAPKEAAERYSRITGKK